MTTLKQQIKEKLESQLHTLVYTGAIQEDVQDLVAASLKSFAREILSLVEVPELIADPNEPYNPPASEEHNGLRWGKNEVIRIVNESKANLLKVLDEIV